MLVLTRRVEEEIVLRTDRGESIVVRIASIRGDKVRVGVEAPTNILVHRREVLEEIERSGESAVGNGQSGEANSQPQRHRDTEGEMAAIGGGA